MPQKLTLKAQDNAIIIQATLVAYIREEEPGIFLSYCPALDLYSQGSTLNKARDNIIEATQLLLEGCIEDGTLDEVLRECGFSLESKKKPVRKRSPKKAVKKFIGEQISFPASVPLKVA